MTEQPAPRPSQVTTACWFVMVSAVLLVATSFDRLSSLQTVELHERISQTLAQPAWKGLGLTAGEVITGWRVVLYVTCAAATAAVVLAAYALRRDRGARWGLAVAAVPVALSAPFSGGFLAAVVGGATLMLWSRAARDWFAGRDPQAPPEPEAFAQPVAPEGTQPQASRVTQSSVSTQPWAAPQPHAAPPYAAGHRRPPAPVGRGRAPGPVRAACILTWVSCGLSALAFLGTILVLATGAGSVVDQVVAQPVWRDSGYDRATALAALWAVAGLLLAWSLGSCVVAYFVLRGASWAWVLLLVSAAFAALTSLLAFPVGLLHVAAAGTAFGLLIGESARTWFADR